MIIIAVARGSTCNVRPLLWQSKRFCQLFFGSNAAPLKLLLLLLLSLLLCFLLSLSCGVLVVLTDGDMVLHHHLAHKSRNSFTTLYCYISGTTLES